jgi:hypothetical protein
MLTHDSITIPNKLLEGRRSERPQIGATPGSERVSFAEDKAYLRSVRLPLMEFASYITSPSGIGRNVILMSHGCQIIAADDPGRAKTRAHPVVEETQDREAAWGAHQRAANLGYLHTPLNHVITFSANDCLTMRHLVETVTDIMWLIANSEGLAEFTVEEVGETCLPQTVTTSDNRIMSKAVRRTSNQTVVEECLLPYAGHMEELAGHS